MQLDHQEVGDSRLPIQVAGIEPAPLDIIRTETELSKYPIHNLAKKGNVNIQIVKTTPEGKVELKWIVSYSDRYGQARQLAYKLDTIVINHHIDELGRPLPKIICLGSLRDIANELDLGGDTNKVRRALRQNASAFITAKFEYWGNDGTKRTLEADFTRYSVIFTGEQLPDGRKADAVYIILNEPYREVLNNAPVRPLDRAYMKQLPPAAQRFYEIVSRKIFAALKNNYSRAKISYSEYCTFSAQLRHYERQRVQDQMAKVIRHHKEFGYITAVKYEPTIDTESKPDWILYLTPGPKAHAEFAVAHGRKIPKKIAEAIEAGEEAKRQKFAQQQGSGIIFESPAPAVDPRFLSEFTRRGVAHNVALHLLAKLKPGQDVVAQLELCDYMVKNSRTEIKNPPGFYVRMIEANTSVPESFETSAKRKAREERERQEKERQTAEEARQLLEWEYDDYCVRKADRYIEENPSIVEPITLAKAQEIRRQHPGFSEDMITTMAAHAAKREIHKQLNLPSFEEFVDLKKQGADFSLKPVAPSPIPEVPQEEQRVVSEMGTPVVEIIDTEAALPLVALPRETAITEETTTIPPTGADPENPVGEVEEVSPLSADEANKPPETPSENLTMLIELAEEMRSEEFETPPHAEAA